MTISDSVADVERSLLAGVSADVGWRLIERFSTLVRESGMADEHAGADYIVDELSRMGIDHEVHEPKLFLSLPRAASVSWNGRECRAKPPAFAVPTPSEGVAAPGVYLPAPPMQDPGEIFDDKHADGGASVRGKIVGALPPARRPRWSAGFSRVSCGNSPASEASPRTASMQSRSVC